MRKIGNGIRLLFACESLVASGGLLRLERVGRVLATEGHECAYLLLSPTEQAEYQPRLGVLSLAEAHHSRWDAVLVPGAGFSSHCIDKLQSLRDPRLGLRVQMILNDQGRREKFLSVNKAFSPDIVVFDNHYWPAGSYREFAGNQFHHLVGGVDTELFSPANP